MDEKQALLKKIKDVYAAPTTNPANFQRFKLFIKK